MEASDAAEHIVEVNEGGEGRAEDEKFRSRVALTIAFMAMLLAITSLGGGNAAEDIMNNNIQASDTWAFYQAKSIRQTANRLAAEQLEADLLINQNSLSPEARQEVQRKIDKFKETAERYESEPDKNDPQNPLKGEGRQQLSARAKNFEEQRDHAQRQDPNFDFAEALFQIAIVLASVAILAMSRLIFKVSLVVGALAFVLMLNGYFLFFTLPI
ncbi:MAG TPA: DUF4337 domain-containing protein [Pyrinomonadaceae bacterium]|jgi:hypothetical protein